MKQWLTYDRSGDEISLERWFELRADPDYCRVLDEYSRRWTVRGAWEGIDRNVIIRNMDAQWHPGAKEVAPVNIFAAYMRVDLRALRGTMEEKVLKRFETEEQCRRYVEALARNLRELEQRIDESVRGMGPLELMIELLNVAAKNRGRL